MIEKDALCDDALQLQYAASLLRRYVTDFSVTDIVRLSRSNKKLLCPVFYLKKYIRSFREGGGKPGVQEYSLLLERLKEYAPDLEDLDVEGMTPAWFAGFKTYIRDREDLTEEQQERCVELLWKTYVDTCRRSGARVLYSADGQSRCSGFQEADFHCLLNNAELAQLSVAAPVHTDFSDACRLLLVKRQSGMHLQDLLELKSDDLHDEGIWYRSSKDNRLCFSALPAVTIALLREGLPASGENSWLFSSPYDGMEDECRRLELKGAWYAGLLKELITNVIE